LLREDRSANRPNVDCSFLICFSITGAATARAFWLQANLFLLSDERENKYDVGRVVASESAPGLLGRRAGAEKRAEGGFEKTTSFCSLRRTLELDGGECRSRVERRDPDSSPVSSCQWGAGVSRGE